MKERKEANQGKMKNGVGSVATEKVRETENNTREEIIRSMRKEAMGFFQVSHRFSTM